MFNSSHLYVCVCEWCTVHVMLVELLNLYLVMDVASASHKKVDNNNLGLWTYIQIFTDSGLTHSKLTKVLSSVATDGLWIHLKIPASVRARIDRHCGDDEEQRREQHIHYYITCCPYALLGWSHVAGRLHYTEEETAERAAKDYVQRAPGTCGRGMCMYWNVEDAHDCVYITHQI